MIPNSSELIEMAHTEWKNRQKRRGYNDEIPWTSGWISGFLTANKPDWEKERDVKTRNDTLDEMIKLSMMIEENETERWESVGRPKNDGYINGSHSGYRHALRDMRQWIDRIKQANGGMIL